MITVYVKRSSDQDGQDQSIYFNLSNGWTRRVVLHEAYKMFIFYMTSNEYRVYIDDVSLSVLQEALKFVECENFTKEQIANNLRQFQFNKYMCSILKFIEK